MKTAPVCSLQVEAGEMPLWLRRKQLIANYWTNLKGHSEDHPTHFGDVLGKRERTKNKLWVGQ